MHVQWKCVKETIQIMQTVEGLEIILMNNKKIINQRIFDRASLETYHFPGSELFTSDKRMTRTLTHAAIVKPKVDRTYGEPLYQYIKWLTSDKRQWSELTDQEQAFFDPFKIIRYLGSDLRLVPELNNFQKKTRGMSKDMFWPLYLSLLSYYIKVERGPRLSWIEHLTK